MKTHTDYYIKRNYPVGHPTIILYKLDESTDSLLRHKAIEILEKRGMTPQQANDYLDALEYVPTRGG